MSGIATAIVGSAVVGAVASSRSASSASAAAERGAASAADATIVATELQIDEIARQFDYQQSVLLPQIQQQYNAQRAYSDLLGIGGPQYSTPAFPATEAQNAYFEHQAEVQRVEQEMSDLSSFGGGGQIGQVYRQMRQQELQGELDTLNQQGTSIAQAAGYDPETGQRSATQAQFPDQGATNFMRGPQGQFVDPNLDPTRLADNTQYRQQVEGNRIAAATPEESILAQRAADTTLMGARGGDLLAEGAAGQGVYGDVFTESPGYAFQVEEMGRELDRKNSAGGNYGGRAIMEAQRRAQGLAAGDYYNWAAGRTQDLQRLGAAEATDINRLDQFAGTDINRGDAAYQTYEQQRTADIGRLDEAASQEDRLRATDLQRQDQAYYNYLANVQAQAGFGGGPAMHSVDASQAAGAASAGAYGQQGMSLSGTYGDLGASQANIEYARGAGINNAFQSGAQNYITWQGYQQPYRPPTGPGSVGWNPNASGSSAYGNLPQPGVMMG